MSEVGIIQVDRTLVLMELQQVKKSIIQLGNFPSKTVKMSKSLSSEKRKKRLAEGSLDSLFPNSVC